MDIAELKNELDKLQKKSIKYDDMSSRYVELGGKIKQAIDILTAVVQEIDPFLTVSNRESSGINWSERIAEIYEKMQSGLEVDRDLVENTYTDMDTSKISYFLTKLSAMPAVEFRKDGRKNIYYVRKDWKK